MTLVQISNFVRVVELQSLSKAASVVHIAQPALSRQVSALEDEMGTSLLIRHGWGVTATPAGMVLADHGRNLLRHAAALRNAVTAISNEPSGLVTLMVPSSLAPIMLPMLSLALSTRYPKVQQHFMDSFAIYNPTRLLAGEFDLAIMSETLAFEPLASSPLFSENLVLAAPRGYNLEGARKTLDILRGVPLIVPSRTHPLRKMVDLATRGTTGNIVLEVDSYPAILELVRLGRGLTVVPYHSIVDDVENNKLAFYELENPPLSRTLSLVRPPGQELTPAISAVENEIRNVVRELASKHRWNPL